MLQGTANSGPEVSKCYKVLLIWARRLEHIERYYKFGAGGFKMLSGIAHLGPGQAGGPGPGARGPGPSAGARSPGPEVRGPGSGPGAVAVARGWGRDPRSKGWENLCKGILGDFVSPFYSFTWVAFFFRLCKGILW